MVKWKGKKCKGSASQTWTHKTGQQQTQNIQNADNAVEMNRNNVYALWMSRLHLDEHKMSGTQWQLPRKWENPLFNHRNPWAPTMVPVSQLISGLWHFNHIYLRIIWFYPRSVISAVTCSLCPWYVMVTSVQWVICVMVPLTGTTFKWT